MLRAIGDNNLPDFTGKTVAVIGGGNVAMDVTRSSADLEQKKYVMYIDVERLI